jgi:hypothetical protein
VAASCADGAGFRGVSAMTFQRGKREKGVRLSLVHPLFHTKHDWH